jgi:alcohol dehydrogenase class IV
VIGGGRPLIGRGVPVFAVPTTAGTGAEVTANAVLASPAHRRKASLRSPHMLPEVAIVDPELTLTCPPAVTAASGLDALTQCLEPLVSVKANPITDGLALEGLRRAGAGLRAAHRDGSNLDARTDMALCSLLGGMALANAKLGAVHGLAGVIGGRVDAAHGAICAALLAATIEVNVRALRARAPDSPALDKYRRAAAALTGLDRATVDDVVTWILRTVAEVGIPGLAALGVSDREAADIATEAAVASSTAGNPIALTTDELTEILHRSH